MLLIVQLPRLRLVLMLQWLDVFIEDSCGPYGLAPRRPYLKGEGLRGGVVLEQKVRLPHDLLWRVGTVPLAVYRVQRVSSTIELEGRLYRGETIIIVVPGGILFDLGQAHRLPHPKILPFPPFSGLALLSHIKGLGEF